MNIHNSILELIGNTPMLRLYEVEKNNSLGAAVIAKLESFNPAGSVKDRIAYAMVKDALDSGKIKDGATIIEPTSGNTGIGICMTAVCLKMKAMIVMPDTISIERIKLMKAYGADVVLTPGAKGMSGAIEEADRLHGEIPNSIVAGQFYNPANPAAHAATTGPEIWRDTDGKVDIFVAGVGSGGTISGIGRYLKSQNPAIKTVAVEPADSPLLTEGKAGPHKIQGIGANIVPQNYDGTVVDEVITATTDDAYSCTRELARTQGVLAGISSGAALHAAKVLALREENRGKNIVVLLPDTGDRYLSVDLF